MSTALAASMVLLTGCLGSPPEPTPTPPAVFASEAEAFAAAEETYRAYIDAVNARRDDLASEPDPQSFLIGEALEADLKSLREFEELGIQIEGDTEIVAIEPISADVKTGATLLETCYDVSNARIINDAGEDVTVADRDPRLLLSVRFAYVDDGLAIQEMAAVDGGAC
ncbi:hypothetical protein HF576_17095 [Microbacterium sp. CFH 90308]|uniref:Nuclear transport factor 2 family protein n=1 Tax=Microbacterium salsuginis TaxID=2722803 RepID=A0ABX1KET0_9MICO|nr:hypothetical protein [Microbacterium sp. CFH 90308]NLP85558.1 hypothetical protein [Microbacterium sp. CFH 90308]